MVRSVFTLGYTAKGTDMADSDPWTPKTRDDWVGMMADGVTKSRQTYEEEVAKAQAGKGGENGGNDNGNGNPPPAKRTLAEFLLGVKSE